MPSKKLLLPDNTKVRVPDKAVGKSMPEYLSVSYNQLDIINNDQ